MTARRGALLVASALCTFLIPGPARAIPAFARAYRTACSTCHVTGPFRLNPFGEAFRWNGYEMPPAAEEELRADEPVPLGAPQRAQLFPDTVWPGAIPGNLPLAVWALQTFVVDLEREDGKTHFEAPTVLQLVMGGTLGWHIGFFASYTLSFKDQFTGLGPLVLVLGRPLGELLPADVLSVRIGKLTPMITPQDGAGDVFGTTVGPVGFSLFDLQAGVELYGRPGGRVLWYAGVVNGETNFDDLTDDKDFYGGIDVKLGGLPMVIEEGPTSSARPWRDGSVVLGVGGYLGHHRIVPEDETLPSYDDRFWRAVGKVRIRVHDLDLLGALVLGRDDDALGDEEDLDFLGWQARADYVLLPWLHAAVRYDEVRLEGAPDTRALGLALRAFARMNLVVQIESSLSLVDDAPEPTITTSLLWAL